MNSGLGAPLWRSVRMGLARLGSGLVLLCSSGGWVVWLLGGRLSPVGSWRRRGSLVVVVVVAVGRRGYMLREVEPVVRRGCSLLVVMAAQKLVRQPVVMVGQSRARLLVGMVVQNRVLLLVVMAVQNQARQPVVMADRKPVRQLVVMVDPTGLASVPELVSGQRQCRVEMAGRKRAQLLAAMVVQMQARRSVGLAVRTLGRLLAVLVVPIHWASHLKSGPAQSRLQVVMAVQSRL